jgi:hypothetical protein
MNKSFSKLLWVHLTVLVLGSFALAPVAEARGGGGGGGGGRGAGGGGAAGAGGGRQTAQVNNSRADSRTNDVRSTSVNNVNNVNVERNVNVNVSGGGGCCNNGWDNDHPVARAAVVVGATAAIVGSMVNTVPVGCVPVNYGGIVYQQCGTTWYQPQGPQFVVVNPPY